MADFVTTLNFWSKIDQSSRVCERRIFEEKKTVNEKHQMT